MESSLKRIAFMGGKKVGYECLKYLLENKTELGVQLSCVFENKSKLATSTSSVGELAKEYNIPLYNNQDELLQFDMLDYIISVQYNQILKQHHINQAKELAINLHMAPVPEYRGCNQFSFAIIDQRTEFGTSLHRLEVSIDGGDLLAERRFNIPKDCFVQDLYKITVSESILLFKNEIGPILKGEYKLIPQAELAKKRDSGFHLRNEVDDIKIIDSTWPIEKQKSYFRATWFPPFSPPIEKQSGKPLDMYWYNSLK
jgi:methionyl-tRNA formyltransferase